MCLKRLTVLPFLVVFLLAMPVGADIFRYVDSNGVIHFTNTQKGEGYSRVLDERESGGAHRYESIIHRKSTKYDIEPEIIKAVITAESNWNPKAVSSKGAIGLMQLMPETARDMDVRNPFDPEENIDGGARYLKGLLIRFDGDLDLALAAYNAGPSRVERAGGIPAIAETNRYVKNVRALYQDSSQANQKIYKVTYSDGTVLYTNTPPPDNR